MQKSKRVVPQWEEKFEQDKEQVIIEQQEVVVINKQKMSKKLLVSLIALIVVLIGIGIWLGMMAMGSKDAASAPSAYSVVEMMNGSVYFGKLSWYPSAKLSNAWVLQRGVDEKNQAQVGVVPIDRAFWNPVNELHLNPDQVVSWSRLRSDSQLVKALENPQAYQQQGQPQGSAPQMQQPSSQSQTPSVPTTKKGE